MKVLKRMPDGRQQIVGLQFPMDLVGRPFSTESQITAESAGDLEVCAIPVSSMERLLKQQSVQHRLHQQSLVELDFARDWMLTLGRRKAPEKVAGFLCLIAMKSSSPYSNEISFQLPLTRNDMADFMGLTTETVSRQLTKLRQEGIIRIVNNRQIDCPNIARLKRAANLDDQA